MKEMTPKELLAGHELIGFSKEAGSGERFVHRASSAKVTTEPVFRDTPKDAATETAAE